MAESTPSSTWRPHIVQLRILLELAGPHDDKAALVEAARELTAAAQNILEEGLRSRMLA